MFTNWPDLELLALILFLPIRDILSLLSSTRRLHKLQSLSQKSFPLWIYLLQRDYPIAWQFAIIEEWEPKEWYECIFLESGVHKISNSDWEQKNWKELKQLSLNSTPESAKRVCQIVAHFHEFSLFVWESYMDLLRIKEQIGDNIQPYLYLIYDIAHRHPGVWESYDILQFLVTNERTFITHRYIFVMWLKLGITCKESKCLQFLCESKRNLFPYLMEELQEIHDLLLSSFPKEEPAVRLWFVEQLRRYHSKQHAFRYLQSNVLICSKWFGEMATCLYDQKKYLESISYLQKGLILARTKVEESKLEKQENEFETNISSWFLWTLIEIHVLKLRNYKEGWRWILEVETSNQHQPNCASHSYYCSFLHCALYLEEFVILHQKWSFFQASGQSHLLPTDFRMVMHYRNQEYQKCIDLFQVIRMECKRKHLRMSQCIGTLGLRMVARSLARLSQCNKAIECLNYYYIQVQPVLEGRDGSLFLERAMIYYWHHGQQKQKNPKNKDYLMLAQLNARIAKEMQTRFDCDAKPLFVFLQKQLSL